MWDWLRQKNTDIAIRPWEARDIQSILEIEDQGACSTNSTTLAEWIYNDQFYGIVLTENSIIKAFSAAFLPKIPQVHIQCLRVDKDNLRRGFGTRILHHLRCGITAWGKISLRIDVSEWNDIACKFLTGKNGFVATIMHEYKDSKGHPVDAFYTFEYPPPNGWKAGTIRISTDDGIHIKSFP